jgi:hypothetical protein
MKYELSFNESVNYDERSIISLIIIIISSAILTFIVTLGTGWQIGFLFGSVSVIFLLIKISDQDRYFITYFCLSDSTVEIEYKEGDDEKFLTGNIKDFSFKKKKVLFEKGRTIYLAISYKNALQLKQYELGEWNEKIFDEIIIKVKG